MIEKPLSGEAVEIEDLIWDSRTQRLLGRDATDNLARASVLVVGVGGVGGYAAEILARTGVGNITVVDADDVAPSNLNRQIIALRDNIGIPKVTLFEERFKKINPDLNVIAISDFLSEGNIESIVGRGYDYVIDAIDTVAPKVALIEYCMRNSINIISSMGAGGRTDPTKIIYTDIWSTKDDGLAKAVRNRLKKDGMRRKLDVVASTEPPHTSSIISLEARNKRSSYGTIAAIPAIFGIYLANKVILKLSKTLSKPIKPGSIENNISK